MTLPLEDELDVLDHEIRKAERNLEDLMRARFDGRWVGTVEDHERRVHFASLKLTDLRDQRARLVARVEAQEDEAA